MTALANVRARRGRNVLAVARVRWLRLLITRRGEGGRHGGLQSPWLAMDDSKQSLGPGACKSALDGPRPVFVYDFGVCL